MSLYVRSVVSIFFLIAAFVVCFFFLLLLSFLMLIVIAGIAAGQAIDWFDGVHGKLMWFCFFSNSSFTWFYETLTQYCSKAIFHLQKWMLFMNNGHYLRSFPAGTRRQNNVVTTLF